VELRIGLAVGVGSASIGGTGPVAASEPDGSRIATIPTGDTWQVVAAGTSLVLTNPSGWSSPPMEAITLAPLDRAAAVRVNGKSYRGLAEVLRDRTGLTVVNRLGLEAYLLGVVSAEMGRRSSTEGTALLAQAVVSRTYALRNLGRWRAQGFDLYATVADQVYGGVGAETPEGRTAVAATRGRVLTHNGALIDALYYSTCGGRTADGYEVFRAAVRPYLRSLPDEAPSGAVYCSISPRYRWREEWTGETLRATLQRNLGETGVTASQVSQVTDVRITKRTSSGRVDQLAFGLGRSEVRVNGTAIRRVLRPANGQLLKSSAFSLGVTGAGAGVSRLTADGMGAGHGVGLCQWGAVGRARAGQGFEQILAAYYPGTKLERRY
jgi:stage II sporulation protein D